MNDETNKRIRDARGRRFIHTYLIKNYMTQNIPIDLKYMKHEVYSFSTNYNFKVYLFMHLQIALLLKQTILAERIFEYIEVCI